MPETFKTESGASINELLSRADEAERSDPSAAIELYDKILKKDALQTMLMTG